MVPVRRAAEAGGTAMAGGLTVSEPPPQGQTSPYVGIFANPRSCLGMDSAAEVAAASGVSDAGAADAPISACAQGTVCIKV